MRVSTLDKALQKQIAAAVRALGNGGVVAIPTDTLYGLASSVFCKSGVERIFRLKGRPKGMALPVLLADEGDISDVALEVPNLARELSKKYWPGALTLVLKKFERVSDLISGGMDTVAVRVPDHPVPRAIVQALGAPITGTSANRTGEMGLTTAEAVQSEFGDEIDLVIDTGEVLEGLASTVLDLTGEYPKILREGAISSREIEQLTGISFD